MPFAQVTLFWGVVVVEVTPTRFYECFISREIDIWITRYHGAGPRMHVHGGGGYRRGYPTSGRGTPMINGPIRGSPHGQVRGPSRALMNSHDPAHAVYQGQPHMGQGQPHPGQGQPHPGQGQLHSGQGSMGRVHTQPNPSRQMWQSHVQQHEKWDTRLKLW